MKKILTVAALLAACVSALAQSTNPLNYSGRMYIEAVEVLSTPRYISYEDHAIVTQRARIPSVQVEKCDMDFEKGTITQGRRLYGYQGEGQQDEEV